VLEQRDDVSARWRPCGPPWRPGANERQEDTERDE